MSTQPESRLQRRIREALEIEFPRSFWFKVHGGPFTRAGIPDLVGCVNGRFFALEVKQPGEEASRVQRKRIAQLTRAGATSDVVESPEEAIAIVTRAIRP